MTKKEIGLIYKSLAGAILIFAFMLYLISDVSPLAKQDPGTTIDLSKLQPTQNQEASGAVELDLSNLDLN